MASSISSGSGFPPVASPSQGTVFDYASTKETCEQFLLTLTGVERRFIYRYVALQNNVRDPACQEKGDVNQGKRLCVMPEQRGHLLAALHSLKASAAPSSSPVQPSISEDFNVEEIMKRQEVDRPCAELIRLECFVRRVLFCVKIYESEEPEYASMIQRNIALIPDARITNLIFEKFAVIRRFPGFEHLNQSTLSDVAWGRAHVADPELRGYLKPALKFVLASEIEMQLLEARGAMHKRAMEQQIQQIMAPLVGTVRQARTTIDSLSAQLQQAQARIKELEAAARTRRR